MSDARDDEVGWAPLTGKDVLDDRPVLLPEMSPEALAARGLFIPESYLRAWNEAKAGLSKGRWKKEE